MRVEAKLGLITLCVLGIAASCGGRAGLEYEPDELFPDASGGSGGAGGHNDKDASVEASSDSSAEDSSLDAKQDSKPKDSSTDTKPKDSATDAKDIFDVLPPFPDSGPIGECGGCLQDQCGTQINACYNDPTCWKGVQCAVQKCLNTAGSGGTGGGGGGQVDLQCLLGCFDNNFSAAMQAYGMFNCITGTCGDLCGLNGGSGGAGGGSAGSGGGSAGGGGTAGSGGNFVGLGAPAFKSYNYIGAVRIPEPEEVAATYPWLADVLEGRTPDPLPPKASE